MIQNPKISVVIPVYNVAKYIERCARSLMEQTLQEAQYIFVNDCSTDNSYEILQSVIHEYPQRKEQVEIYTNETNAGSATTRNNGLLHVRGEYLMFLDADDWFDTDALENVYSFIKWGNLDICYSDTISEYGDGNQIVTKQPEYNSLEETQRAMLRINISTQPCNKAYRWEFVKKTGEKFVDGADMAEDKSLNIRLFLKAKKISYYTGEPFYHYNLENENSISHFQENEAKLRKNFCASKMNYEAIEKTIKALGLEEKYAEELLLLQLATRGYLLKLCTKKSLHEWMSLYPSSNKEIFRQNYSLKNKILLWLLSIGFWYPYYYLNK
ncbi:MAG TPA: glycosyltransferase family 2 protein [Paludibacteraceae bacterium]|nr:glycosyltransferase family 2 protein [Paludibacteraceae bacterium]